MNLYKAGRPFVACCNNEGASPFVNQQNSVFITFLFQPYSDPWSAEYKPDARGRTQHENSRITVSLNINYTCILTVKGNIQLFPPKNTRSLSDNRRARNNFSGSFQKMQLKIMKTEELSVFGNYLLFICFTFPDPLETNVGRRP